MTPARLEIAQPLPECAMCETPTVRDTWNRTGGLCTACHDTITETASRLPRAVGGPTGSWVEVDH